MGAEGYRQVRRTPNPAPKTHSRKPNSLWQRVCRLYGGEELRGVTALLARAVARSLPAAEGHVVVDARGRKVDHHHAGLGIALEVRGVFEARRADARGQAERRIVGDGEGLVIVLDADHARDRAEDLLAVDAHLRPGLGEQRRLQVEAGRRALEPLAAKGEPGALLLADLDVAFVLIGKEEGARLAFG